MDIDINKLFDEFFEFPTDDKSQVTSTSCKLFAIHVANEYLQKLKDEMKIGIN